MLLAYAALALALIYLALNVILVALRNHRAHQFFATKSPKLPVLPRPNIFSGHIFSTTWPGKNVQILTKLHAKYGRTFGFYMADQPWVCTKDLDLLKLIELDQPHKHINRSKFGLPMKEFNQSIFQVDDDQWRRIRRAISPALTNHKVKADEVTSDILHVLEQLVEGLEMRLDRAAKANNGRREFTLNVRDMFQRYTLAVIFLVTYKRDGDIDFKASHDQWVEALDGAAMAITNPIVALSIMFPFARYFCDCLIQLHPIGRLRLKVVDYIIEAADINRAAREHHSKFERKRSLETGEPEKPFSAIKSTKGFKRRLVDTIIDTLLERRIDLDEFVASALFLLLAGYETTADTISCLIWHLARAPQIQEQLRRAIDEEGLESDYLMWCIQETIRWHPAVPLGTGRILGEDVTVNGLKLAKGTFVMPNVHAIHHDSSIWPEADEFKPERWRQAADIHPAAFMGFGLGPRNCVGGKLAVHEIKLVMKTLLSRYRIEHCEETSAGYEFTSPGLLYTILDEPIRVRLVDLRQCSVDD